MMQRTDYGDVVLVMCGNIISRITHHFEERGCTSLHRVHNRLKCDKHVIILTRIVCLSEREICNVIVKMCVQCTEQHMLCADESTAIITVNQRAYMYSTCVVRTTQQRCNAIRGEHEIIRRAYGYTLCLCCGAPDDFVVIELSVRIFGTKPQEDGHPSHHRRRICCSFLFLFGAFALAHYRTDEFNIQL